MESVNKITLNKQNMHTLKRSTCRGSARVTASRQDTCEPPPRQDPVPRPARTFCGTGWTFAKDCGTASPGLETPDVKWGVGGVQKNKRRRNKTKQAENPHNGFKTRSAYLHLKQMWQMLSFGLPHTVPSVGDKHHRHLVFPIAVHQVPEALLGCRDQCPAPNQHPVNVKEEPKGAGALRREWWHVQRENTRLFINWAERSSYISSPHTLRAADRDFVPRVYKWHTAECYWTR